MLKFRPILKSHNNKRTEIERFKVHQIVNVVILSNSSVLQEDSICKTKSTIKEGII